MSSTVTFIKKYLTTGQAAKLLGTSQTWIKHLCAKGIFGQKCGHIWLILKDDLLLYKRQVHRLRSRK